MAERVDEVLQGESTLQRQRQLSTDPWRHHSKPEPLRKVLSACPCSEPALKLPCHHSVCVCPQGPLGCFGDSAPTRNQFFSLPSLQIIFPFANNIQHENLWLTSLGFHVMKIHIHLERECFRQQIFIWSHPIMPSAPSPLWEERLSPRFWRPLFRVLQPLEHSNRKKRQIKKWMNMLYWMSCSQGYLWREKSKVEGEVSLLMFFFIIIKWGKSVKKLKERTGWLKQN